MKNVKQSGRFKKDVKRYKHKDAELKKLFQIVEMLRQGKQGHINYHVLVAFHT